MTDVQLTTRLRFLALALLGCAALGLSGCADEPGGSNGGTTGGGGGGGCPDGSSDCTTPPPVQCPSGQTFRQIAVNNAQVSVDNSAGACISCKVEDAIDTVDAFTNNFAIMTVSVGLINGGNSITITDTKDHFPAGSLAGFVVEVPDAPVATAELLKAVKVTNINDGKDTIDSAGAKAPLTLDLLGLINKPNLAFVTSGPATTPYNAARLNLGGVLSALNVLRVYGAGVCQ